MGDRDRHHRAAEGHRSGRLPGGAGQPHAPFTWGPNVAKAVETAVAVECVAHMALMSLQLAPDLKQIETELRDKHFKRKHGPGAYYGQAKKA